MQSFNNHVETSGQYMLERDLIKKRKLAAAIKKKLEEHAQEEEIEIRSKKIIDDGKQLLNQEFSFYSFGLKVNQHE